MNSSNNNYWYGIAFTSYITEAKVSGMNYIDIITVSTSGGLIDTSYALVNYTDNVTPQALTTATSNGGSLGSTFPNLTFNTTTVSIDIPVGIQEDKTAEIAATTTIVITSVAMAVVAANVVFSASTGTVAGGGAGAGVGVGGAGLGARNVALVGTGVGAGVEAEAEAEAEAGRGNSSSNSKSNKQRLWAIINLYQEILLIPILGTYLGNDFHFYLTEFELALFGFQFLKFVEFPVFEIGPSIIDEIDYEQPDELFADNEFESGSAFFNCFQILKVIFIIFIFNLGYLIYK